MTIAGPMREVVRIEQRSTTQDALGEESTTWVLVAQRRAAVVAMPGSEVWASKERHGRVPTMFRMRWPADVTVLPSMRIVWRGRLFNIVSAVDETGRRTDLLVTCDELVGEPTS